jgi:prevent-host-death family protein
MVRTYSIPEAQDDLSGVVREAENGTRIELTREGRPVAVLLRLPVEEMPCQGDFWAAYEEFRRTHDLISDPIDPDEVFVRDKSPGPGRDFSW